MNEITLNLFIPQIAIGIVLAFIIFFVIKSIIEIIP